MDKIILQLSLIKNNVAKSSLIQPALNWHGALSIRDKKIVNGLGGLFVIALVFNLVWNPSYINKHKAQARLASEITFHNKLKENAYLFSSPAQSVNGGSILTTINTTAKAKGIQLQRFEPDGKQGIRIWLDQVSFDMAIDWIETLETDKNILIEQITVDKVSTGIVNIRAVLRG